MKKPKSHHHGKPVAADDLAVMAELCAIAARLGVPVVTPRQCPDSGRRNWKNIAGMYVADGGGDRDLRATLKLLHVKPPCIVLRYQTASVLVHELGHHVAMFDTMLDSRTDRRVSPLLARLCERHKIIYYGKDEITRLGEIRARCIEHRWMGSKTLPATLRRFCARAWADLEDARHGVGF